MIDGGPLRRSSARSTCFACSLRNPDREWRPLYTAGGISALTILALVPFQIFIFVTSPPPTTPLGWFELFDRSPFLGLIDMDLLLIVDQMLIAVMLAAVIVALRASHRAWLVLAGMFGAVAFASYLASNPVLEMFALAKRYAAAASETERGQLLAAGLVLVEQWIGTAFSVGYILGGVAFTIVGVVMLRSERFGRATAWIGIVFGLTSLVPASAGTLGLVFALVSLIPMWIWLALIARRLLRLGGLPTGTACERGSPIGTISQVRGSRATSRARLARRQARRACVTGWPYAESRGRLGLRRGSRGRGDQNTYVPHQHLDWRRRSC
ncbi:MAG TPA: hypothetical protein VNO30_22735 [Kofleriaceae bacterium]|nr:hypothetical protein [Kofleriaceae bacterium]